MTINKEALIHPDNDIKTKIPIQTIKEALIHPNNDKIMKIKEKKKKYYRI